MPRKYTRQQWRRLYLNERIRKGDRPLTMWGVSEKASWETGKTVKTSGHFLGVVRPLKPIKPQYR